jgi:hypothetical protein
MRRAFALLLALALQVGVLALINARPDLDASTFIATYWFPVAAVMVAIIALYRD